jgi:Zn-dependent alcohol dehydrogenase
MRNRAAILHEYGRPRSVEEFELDPPRAGEVPLSCRSTTPATANDLTRL